MRADLGNKLPPAQAAQTSAPTLDAAKADEHTPARGYGLTDDVGTATPAPLGGKTPFIRNDHALLNPTSAATAFFAGLGAFLTAFGAKTNRAFEKLEIYVVHGKDADIRAIVEARFANVDLSHCADPAAWQRAIRSTIAKANRSS